MTLRLGGDGAITGCTSLEEPTISISGLTMTTPIEAVSGTAAAPSYTFSGDTDNGLYYAGTNSIGLSTAGNNAILIDSSGKVGIGTASPANNLDLAIDSNNEGIRLSSSTNVFGKIDFHANRSGADAALGILDFNWNNTQVARIIGGTGTDTTNKDDGVLQFHTAAAGSASEAMRIDSSGKLLIGTNVARSNFYNSTNSPHIQLEGSGSNSNYALSVVSNFAGSTLGAQLILAKSGSASVGGNTLVSDGNTVGVVNFQGADGSHFVECAKISSVIDGTPGTDDMPGALIFSTTGDGEAGSTERMRIDSSGNVGIGGNPTVFTGQNFISIHSPGSSTNIAGIDLHVSGTREAGMISYPSIGESLRIFGNGARSITFHNNSAERMRIDSSGNVGIGITPQRHLHIHQSSSATVGMMLTNGATGAANDSQGFQLKVGSDTHAEVAQMENSNLRFLTNAQERMRILAAGGLTFNGDTAQANALDDYEEGSCTITLFVAGTSTTNSATNTVAYYSKVGNIVNVSYYSALLSITNSGTAEINGLPFVAKNVNQHYPPAVFTHTNCFTTDIQNGYMNVNSTNLYPIQRNSTAQAIWNTSGGARYLMFSITYQTN